MESGAGLQERIWQAADALYAENERASFPTVDAVRKRAKVNMNDASTGMRAWRRSQAGPGQAPAVQMPEKIQQSTSLAMAALWSEALAHAGESLRLAQAGWDKEREEVNTMAEQMANAFEVQAAELEAAHSEKTQLTLEISRLNEALARLQAKHDETSRALALSQAMADQALVKAAAIETRADDLRHELDRAHATVTDLRKEAFDERRAHESTVKALHNDFVRQLEKAQINEKSAQDALCEAREANSVLRGKLDAADTYSVMPSELPKKLPTNHVSK